jgi:hypothetical protein
MGDPYAVLSSTPGSAKPIFHTVSNSIVLLDMGECDYRQEQEPFQGRRLQLRVLVYVDHTHPAPAEVPDDAVVQDGLPTMGGVGTQGAMLGMSASRVNEG